jgi:hypothetical protein
MSSLDPRSVIGSHESFVDWDELSGLDRVTAIHQAGTNVLLIETKDGREIRITAWFNRHTGRYMADYEKRSSIASGGQQLRVWAQTPAYTRCVADDLTGCLEAAVLEVDRHAIY